eukprot:TRINITY_DN92892_c0_g1_i1.p1 TRINITY_DN92892_c0_g1~~TRINITY_DN92892_c0_g1_i1.p1  ORF type:complete len:181 (+),score=30.54 TRINITY_DN92892_c0_g1_i1:40-582(+)
MLANTRRRTVFIEKHKYSSDNLELAEAAKEGSPLDASPSACFGHTVKKRVVSTAAIAAAGHTLLCSALAATEHSMNGQDANSDSSDSTQAAYPRHVAPHAAELGMTARRVHLAGSMTSSSVRQLLTANQGPRPLTAEVVEPVTSTTAWHGTGTPTTGTQSHDVELRYSSTFQPVLLSTQY